MCVGKTVFPDEELAGQKCVIIQFDGDPAADDEQLSKLTDAERLRLTGGSSWLSLATAGRLAGGLSIILPDFLRDQHLTTVALYLGIFWVRCRALPVKLLHLTH